MFTINVVMNWLQPVAGTVYVTDAKIPQCLCGQEWYDKIDPYFWENGFEPNPMRFDGLI